MVDCEKERNKGNGAAAVMVAACFEACEQGKEREERVRLLWGLDSVEMGTTWGRSPERRRVWSGAKGKGKGEDGLYGLAVTSGGGEEGEELTGLMWLEACDLGVGEEGEGRSWG